MKNESAQTSSIQPFSGDFFASWLAGWLALSIAHSRAIARRRRRSAIYNRPAIFSPFLAAATIGRPETTTSPNSRQRRLAQIWPAMLALKAA